MKTYSATLVHVSSGKEYSYSNVTTDDLVRKDLRFDAQGNLLDQGTQSNVRFLVLESKERIEFPMEQFIVHWGKERQEMIEESQAKQAAQREASKSQP